MNDLALARGRDPNVKPGRVSRLTVAIVLVRVSPSLRFYLPSLSRTPTILPLYPRPPCPLLPPSSLPPLHSHP